MSIPAKMMGELGDRADKGYATVLNGESSAFHVRRLAEQHDAIAPDGSEIRLLGAVGGASVVHCTLPAGGVTTAVVHRTVEEVWFVVGGRGQVWRSMDGEATVTDVEAGVSLTIPLGVVFQFRTAGEEPLQIVIATAPPWPGDGEAEARPGYWR